MVTKQKTTLTMALNNDAKTLLPSCNKNFSSH